MFTYIPEIFRHKIMNFFNTKWYLCGCFLWENENSWLHNDANGKKRSLEACFLPFV